MKLSIIVPVYNVERYVRKCILSIINQEDGLFNGVELIIVNDGAKDKSVEQIQDLVDKFKNITLINQENQGLSMARNNGMAHAKGDYLWFIDSDDWIASNALKVLNPYLDGKNDIISFAITQTSEQGEMRKYVFFNEVRTMSGKELFRQKCEHETMVQKAVYRKDFFADYGLRFMPGVYNEDDELCLRASYLADTVTLLPESLYYFLRTTGDAHKSITNTVNPKLGYDFLIVAKSISRFSKENVKEVDVSRRFNYHIAVLVNNGLDAIYKCSEENQRVFCEMYKQCRELNTSLICAGGKYFFEAVLFALMPNRIVKVYNFLKRIKA